MQPIHLFAVDFFSSRPFFPYRFASLLELTGGDVRPSCGENVERLAAQRRAALTPSALCNCRVEEGRAVVGAAKADPDLPKVNLGACLREKGRENKLKAISVCSDLVEACIQKCMAKYRATYGGRIGCNSMCQE